MAYTPAGQVEDADTSATTVGDVTGTRYYTFGGATVAVRTHDGKFAIVLGDEHLVVPVTIPVPLKTLVVVLVVCQGQRSVCIALCVGGLGTVMRCRHTLFRVVRVVAPGRVLRSRLFGFLFTLGMGAIALGMLQSFDAENSTFPYKRMMIGYGLIAVSYVPYSLVCLALELGLAPRVFILSRARGGSAQGETRVITWRSVWVARAVSASLDSPLEVTVKSKPRAGNLPGFKVDVTLRDFDRRVRLRLVTLDTDGAAAELLAKLRQAGVNVTLVTGSGATC